MSLSQLFAYLDAGVSRFHSAACGVERLRQAGFLPLEETARWPELIPGQGYYITRNGSSVVAFKIPRQLEAFRLLASHGDSPTFFVKGSFAPAGGTTRLEVEGYGGMLMATWLDRPLTMAGRAMVRRGDTLTAQPVYFDRDLLVIPSLCIHFDREARTGKTLNPQVDLQPLLGGMDAPTLQDMTAQELGVPAADVISVELTLCPRQKAVRLGAKGEFFTAPRIDDLECAATTLEGFLQAEPAPGVCTLWAQLDNEEVGSSTRQGACGTFVRDVLEGIAEAMGVSGQALRRVLANSMGLSADNGHAVHPNHPEKSDPLNAPILNGGVLLKVNASKKYTTDGVMEAVVRELCTRNDIPVQTFANRADIPGGSTLGNLLQHTVSIPMADIGAGQLAMHSCVETAGCADALALEQLSAAFCAADITCLADGQYRFG